LLLKGLSEDILIFLVIHIYAWSTYRRHYFNYDDTCQAFLFPLPYAMELPPAEGVCFLLRSVWLWSLLFFPRMGVMYGRLPQRPFNGTRTSADENIRCSREQRLIGRYGKRPYRKTRPSGMLTT